MKNTKSDRFSLPKHKALRPFVVAIALVFAAPLSHAIELTDLDGVVATASRCYLGCGNDRYDASNILDGDFGATGNTGLNAWNSGIYGGYVDLDLTASYVLDRIELYGVYSYYNPFTLSVSVDGLGWTTVAIAGYGLEPDLPEAGVGGVRYGAVFDVADGSMASGLNARYLRYSVNAGSPHWGYLVEIDVQGHLAPVPEPEAGLLMLAGLGLIAMAARSRAR